MERLTFRDNTGNACLLWVSYGDGHCLYVGDKDVLNRLADYEDAEEAGLLVRLPCKPREVVWVYYPKYKEIERISYMTQSEILEDIELGAIICRTREEAEAVLAKEG